MNRKNEKDFYHEVDRSRYRANWSCLIWFFFLVLALVAVGWYLAEKFGYV